MYLSLFQLEKTTTQIYAFILNKCIYVSSFNLIKQNY